MTRRILVVEDDPNVCLLYETELRGDGYEVETAASGAEVLAVIDRRVPDLVVLDIKLESENGLEILGEIRTRHHDLPVVINTAYPYFKGDFSTWGADAYVVKSADLGELKRTVRSLLHGATSGTA